METYVINLSRRPDRLAHMRSEMAKHRIDFMLMPAVDDRDIDLESYPLLPGKERRGNVGCIISHRLVWREMDMLGIERAIVFEDDAILCDDFNDRLPVVLSEMPADCDILFLGCGHRGDVMRTSQIASVDEAWTTHAYVVTRAGARKMLLHVVPAHWPVDSQISECPVIRKYAVLPIMAWQPWFVGPLTEPWMEKCS